MEQHREIEIIWEEHDKKDGVHHGWYDNGQMESQWFMLNGTQVGQGIGWHSNGLLRYTGFFVDGKEEGKHKWYYNNGQLKGICFYEKRCIDMVNLVDTGKLIKRNQ